MADNKMQATESEVDAVKEAHELCVNTVQNLSHFRHL
jgi:hypothetical protein